MSLQEVQLALSKQRPKASAEAQAALIRLLRLHCSCMRRALRHGTKAVRGRLQPAEAFVQSQGAAIALNGAATDVMQLVQHLMEAVEAFNHVSAWPHSLCQNNPRALSVPKSAHLDNGQALGLRSPDQNPCTGVRRPGRLDSSHHTACHLPTGVVLFTYRPWLQVTSACSGSEMPISIREAWSLSYEFLLYEAERSLMKLLLDMADPEDGHLAAKVCLHQAPTTKLQPSQALLYRIHTSLSGCPGCKAILQN